MFVKETTERSNERAAELGGSVLSDGDALWGPKRETRCNMAQYIFHHVLATCILLLSKSSLAYNYSSRLSILWSLSQQCWVWYVFVLVHLPPSAQADTILKMAALPGLINSAKDLYDLRSRYKDASVLISAIYSESMVRSHGDIYETHADKQISRSSRQV